MRHYTSKAHKSVERVSSNQKIVSSPIGPLLNLTNGGCVV
jgi:hypothetical protein